MQKTIKLLAALLVVQLLLAAGLGLFNRGLSMPVEPTPLIAVAKEDIDHITLEGADGKVSLVKQGAGWQLPQVNGFPADHARIAELIDQLVSLQTGLPLSTHRAAQERFKVSDDLYERRITLAQGDKSLARLYLGTTPGMRLVQARNGDSDAIVTVKMAVHEVPTKTDDWIDKAVLTLSKSTIDALSVNGLRIQRSGTEPAQENTQGDTASQTAWSSDNLKQGSTLNTQAVERLAELLADLPIDKVLGSEAKAEYALDHPVLEVAITLAGGDRLLYRLGKTADTEVYTLKVSNRAEYFRLANYIVKPLLAAASLDRLTETAPQAGEMNATTGQPPSD
ncbi:MAG: DUF4340 domain-containing protein [Gammaproteobacteria bacterium]|nr:DUF4340 domain-containing protein [Gammaproteobacteria bacterium]